jgi:Fe-S cluster assembly protein SufD
MDNLIIQEGEEKTYFGECSAVTVKKGGKLHHYWKSENADLKVYVEEGGFYDSLLLLLPENAAKGRIKVDVNLMGKKAEAVSNAVYLLNEKNDFSLNMTVNHLSSDTTSNQHAKGILTGSSFLDFVGLVNISPKLKGISGNQMNEAMILSDSARIQCVPELAIMSEDVKCTHGASLGNLDEQQLFYLQSRGLPYNTAKYLILTSFANSLTDNITDANVKKALCERINEWLKINL